MDKQIGKLNIDIYKIFLHLRILAGAFIMP